MINTIRVALFIGALVFVVGLALDHDPQSDLRIGWRAYRAGDMDSALRMARLASLLADKSTKEWQESQILQTRAALKMKKRDYAHKKLNTLLSLHPDNFRGLQLRGELRLEQNDAKGALADLKRSIKNTSKPHKSEAQIIAQRAQAFLQVGDLDSAVQDVKLAYKLNPRNQHVLYSVSLVLEKQGKYLPALQFMEKALYTANRLNSGFFMSDQGKKWTSRLISLRAKAKVPNTRPYVPGVQ